VIVGVLAGVEGVLAAVVAYLGFLLMSAQPANEATAHGVRAPATARAGARARAPGIGGALRHFFGPLPEGRPITIGSGEAAESDSRNDVSTPIGKPGASPPAAVAPSPAGRALGGVGEGGDARAAAARAAAARAAASSGSGSAITHS